MMARKIVAAALCAAIGLEFAGCTSASAEAVAPAQIENVAVTPAQGRTLSGAIITAAARRGWSPSAQADGTIRCTLTQRQHLVVVDVVPNGEQSFSIRPVQSNIPVRKYDQWVNNLSREIVVQASR